MIPIALKVVKTAKTTKQIFEYGNIDWFSPILSLTKSISLASDTSYTFDVISDNAKIFQVAVTYSL